MKKIVFVVFLSLFLCINICICMHEEGGMFGVKNHIICEEHIFHELPIRSHDLYLKAQKIYLFNTAITSKGKFLLLDTDAPVVLVTCAFPELLITVSKVKNASKSVMPIVKLLLDKTYINKLVFNECKGEVYSLIGDSAVKEVVNGSVTRLDLEKVADYKKWVEILINAGLKSKINVGDNEERKLADGPLSKDEMLKPLKP